MKNNSNRPIIYKKVIRKTGGGHHGGAWKVAYADFMTAMMAFFLLLWLLSESEAGKARGVASYFQPKVQLVNIGGEGVLDGESTIQQNMLESVKSENPDPSPISSDSPEQKSGTEDEKAAFAAESALKTGVSENQLAAEVENPWVDFAENPPLQKPALDQTALSAKGIISSLEAFLEENPDRARVSMQSDGSIRIDLLDLEGKPLFATGSFAISGEAEPIVARIVESLVASGGQIVITGHTDAAPYAGNGYTNWELSTDRANAVRRALLAAGLEPGRITQVIGAADMEPANAEDPMSAENRRVSIVIRS